MEPVKIAEKIKEEFPEEIIDIKEFRGQVSAALKKDRIVEICRYLHGQPELYFDYLTDLCAVDYLGKKSKRFEVVYHLYSIRHRHRFRLKAEVSESDPAIDSVTPVWVGADWHEREAFDLFGIVFNGHPDLRRILLPEDWEGYPLRKDYPVKGPEKEWPGFLEVVEKAKKFEGYEWHESEILKIRSMKFKI
jgi:NADH-quinone oxidoreductase subunit C